MGLATVMVKEHTGRAVHLRDDDPLCAVHDKGTVRGHQRHVAHVDVLLLDVADRPRTRDLILFPNFKAKRYLEGRRIGQTSLLALLDIIFRLFEIVRHKFEFGAPGKILNREDRPECFLKSMLATVVDGNAHLQECVIARALHVDQVRHGRDFRQLAESPANTPATIECAYMRCHLSTS